MERYLKAQKGSQSALTVEARFLSTKKESNLSLRPVVDRAVAAAGAGIERRILSHIGHREQL